VSVKITSAVWELDLPLQQKMIALAFGDHSNDEGLCYPSIARIAWKSNLSERQTQNHVRALRKIGFLELLDDTAGGRGITNLYRLHPERVKRLSPFIPKGCNPARERVKPNAPKGCNPARERVKPASPESSLTLFEPSVKRGAPNTGFSISPTPGFRCWRCGQTFPTHGQLCSHEDFDCPKGARLATGQGSE
jgi:Helix-turn-helix domain